MTDSPIYPGPRVPLLGRDGGVALAWQQFFRSLAQQAGGVDLSAEIEAIARKLGSPDGSIDGIPAPLGTATVIGVGGVQSAGSLAEGRVTLFLRQLEDNAEGALLGIERDAFGRVAGTKPVTAGDGITITDTGTEIELAATAQPIDYTRITAEGDVRVTADGDLRITD